MPKTYRPADADTIDLLQDVLAEHFSVLAELRPTLIFDVQMVENHDKDGDLVIALRSKGHACAGMIKRVPDDERAKDGDAPDLRIFLDALLWSKKTDQQRRAVLHHEASHVEPKRDKLGMVQEDQYGRVRIRLRPDDWMLTGFRETVRIFGSDATERDSLDRVMASIRQQALPFGDERSPHDVPSVVSFTGEGFAEIGGERRRKAAASQ